MFGDEIRSVAGSSLISIVSGASSTSAGEVLFAGLLRVTAFLILVRPLEVAALRTLMVGFNRRGELREAGDVCLGGAIVLVGEIDLDFAVCFTGDSVTCVTFSEDSSNGRSDMALITLLGRGSGTGEVDLSLECGIFAAEVDLIRAATCSVGCFIGDVDLVLEAVFFALSGVTESDTEPFRGDACPVDRVVFKGDPGPADNDQSSPA